MRLWNESVCNGSFIFQKENSDPKLTEKFKHMADQKKRNQLTMRYNECDRVVTTGTELNHC